MKKLLSALFIVIFVAPIFAENENNANLQSVDTVIFCCSESLPDPGRVLAGPLGQVAFVRNMGNVVDVAGSIPSSVEVGSVEFAVTALGAKKVIVLGHKGCSLIKAVAANPTGIGNQPAIYAVISKSITQARKRAKSPEEILDKAVEYNVMNTVNELRNSRFILNELVKSGKLEVFGAVYDPALEMVEYLEVK